MSRTFTVDPMAVHPTVRTYTDGTAETFTFRTKAQADKKIMKLIAAGYKFDSQAPKTEEK